MTVKLFCDSGAFSAYHNNTEIKIGDYIEFIKRNLGNIETFANLDDIGNPENTWANQKILEEAGLNPIPVYHLGEPEKFLHKCMEYPYFAVGGIASKLTSAGSLQRYLDRVFLKICRKENDYLPSHKVHGFGIATPKLLIRYPWYSADTTSWVQYGRYGIILIPRFQNDRFHYDKAPMTLAVSSRSKAIGDEKHFINQSDMDKEWIIKYITDKGFKIGRTEFKKVSLDYELSENENWTDRKIKDKVEVVIEKGLCCDGEMRDKLNLEYFLDLEKYQPKWPWPFRLHDTRLQDENGNSIFD
jgi:hypothetical protein